MLQAEFDGIQNWLSPRFVTVRVEVEAVGGKESRIGLALGVEQRRGHVDDAHTRMRLREEFEPPVELRLDFKEMHP